MHRVLFFLLWGLVFFSCDDSEIIEAPQNLIDEKTYLDIFIDLQLFNAMIQSVDSVANQDSLRLALFDHYSISEKDFLETHTYYQSQPTLQKVRLDSASNRIEKILTAMNEARNEQANQ